MLMGRHLTQQVVAAYIRDPQALKPRTWLLYLGIAARVLDDPDPSIDKGHLFVDTIPKLIEKYEPYPKANRSATRRRLKDIRDKGGLTVHTTRGHNRLPTFTLTPENIGNEEDHETNEAGDGAT